MQAEKIKNICVVGAGMMGHGIAQVFAAKDFNVYIYARRHEGLLVAMENIRSNLSRMVQKGVIKESDIEKTISRISTTMDMGEATANAQLVIENVSENMELKQHFFHELDQLCSPETILTTNTSVMSISEIASKAERRERIVGTHFWNPPYLIPLVEVVKGNDTSDEVMETTYQVMKIAGKRPVKVMKDVPGFLCNRLQHALWREAVSIVQNGIADAAGVDEAIKTGFGLRLPVLAPLENADMVGLDLILAIHNYIFKYLEDSHEPSPILREKVEKGELGFKSGKGFYTWTDDEIAASRNRLIDYLLDWKLKERNK